MPLRLSCSAFAHIVQHRGEQSQWLLQWNSGWRHLNFVGGHQEGGETFRACVERETCEELGIEPRHLTIARRPLGHFHVIDWSICHAQLTEFTFELFDTDILLPQTDAEALISSNSDNVWVSLDEIARGFTTDGRPISLTVQRLLATIGCLPPWAETKYTIGVTGHRDIENLRSFEMRTRIDAALDDLADRAGGRPIRLLSPLAAGADQCVAQCACERGWEVQAPLPLPVDVYEDDFSPNDLQEFRRLLAAANDWFTVVSPLGYSAELDRSLFYHQVGRYIVERSDALIALWDGRPHRRHGGTADILHHAMHTAQTLRPVSVAWVRVSRG